MPAAAATSASRKTTSKSGTWSRANPAAAKPSSPTSAGSRSGWISGPGHLGQANLPRHPRPQRPAPGRPHRLLGHHEGEFQRLDPGAAGPCRPARFRREYRHLQYGSIRNGSHCFLYGYQQGEIPLPLLRGLCRLPCIHRPGRRNRPGRETDLLRPHPHGKAPERGNDRDAHPHHQLPHPSHHQPLRRRHHRIKKAARKPDRPIVMQGSRFTSR